jgi:hypothetical protein
MRGNLNLAGDQGRVMESMEWKAKPIVAGGVEAVFTSPT